jgi:hypothetical protein
MKVIAPSSEDEMIASFIRAGLDSPGEREALAKARDAAGLDEADARSLDIADPALNKLRREVLTKWFGWGQYESVFGGMPDDIEWHWAELTLDDLRKRVYTIKWSFEAEYGTRQLARIAERNTGASAGPILDALRSGQTIEPVMLLAQPSLDRLVILEGHNRLEAFLTEPTLVSFPLRVFLGISERVDEWSEW